MGDILADIQRCLGAQSVNLPSRLDIISLRPPSWFEGKDPKETPHSQPVKDIFHASSTGEELFLLDEELDATSDPLAFADALDPKQMRLPKPVNAASSNTPEWPGKPRDSGYGSLNGTPD